MRCKVDKCQPLLDVLCCIFWKAYLYFSPHVNSSRFGPYESFDSRSAVGGRDLYRSGYGYNESDQGYGDSYDGRYENPYRNSGDSYEGRNQGGSSWDPSFTRAKVRTGFMEDRGRDSYSSYGGFSSPYMKPAAVGSRGRGMPAYPDSAFGGRSNDAFGGPAAGRGRGRGGVSTESSQILFNNHFDLFEDQNFKMAYCPSYSIAWRSVRSQGEKRTFKEVML